MTAKQQKLSHATALLSLQCYMSQAYMIWSGAIVSVPKTELQSQNVQNKYSSILFSTNLITDNT